jgi:hypothetical protein
MRVSPSGRWPSKARASMAPRGLTTFVRRYMGVLTLAVLAVAAAPAQAQTPPVEDGTNVGGDVGSTLELILPKAGGFATFKRAGSFTFSFNVKATTTETRAEFAIVDGDASSGSKLGHMSAGSKRLPDPLEARVGKSAFQPLDESFEPFSLSGPFTRKTSKVTLRQKVRSKPSGTYHKLVLITASSETP